MRTNRSARPAGFDFTPAEMKHQADQLRQAAELSSRFYAAAASIGLHPVIEHTGLLNEHLKMLRRAHEEGCDLLEANKHSGRPMPPMYNYEAEYLAEKFMCIFAPFFDEASWKAFVAACEKEFVE